MPAVVTFSPVRGDSNPRGARLRARRRSLLLVGFVVACSVTMAPGAAYASGTILPGLTIWEPVDVVNAAEALTAGAAPVVEGVGVGAGGIAACVGGVCEGAVVAGAILGTGMAFRAAWHLGNNIAAALPCIFCGPEGVSHPDLSSDYSAVEGPACDGSSPGLCIQNGYLGFTAGDPSGAQVGIGPATGNGSCRGDFDACFFGVKVKLTTNYGTGEYNLQLRESGTSNAGGSAVVYCDAAGFSNSGCLIQAVQVHAAPVGAFGSSSTGSATWRRPTYAGPALTGSTGGGPTVTPGPLAQLVATSSCRDLGGTVSAVTATSASFHQTDTALPPLAAPACAPGDTRVGWTVKAHPLDGSVPDVDVVKKIIPTAVPAGLPPAVADCLPGGAAAPCQLTLSRVLTDRTTRPYDPAVDPDPSTDADKDRDYECRWGSHVVPVAQCVAIYTPTHPRQVPTVDPSSPVPGEKPSDIGHCVSSGVGLNPITWVYVPVKCALRWAFVPDQAAVNGDVAQVKSALDGSAIGAAVGAVTSVVGPYTALVSSGDCQGPVVTLTIPVAGDTSAHPFDTCGELPQMVLGVLLPIETFVVYAAALFGGARILARTVGAESL